MGPSHTPRPCSRVRPISWWTPASWCLRRRRRRRRRTGSAMTMLSGVRSIGFQPVRFPCMTRTGRKPIDRKPTVDRARRSLHVSNPDRSLPPDRFCKPDPDDHTRLCTYNTIFELHWSLNILSFGLGHIYFLINYTNIYLDFNMYLYMHYLPFLSLYFPYLDIY